MEQTVSNTSNAKNGLTFGIIIGLIYCLSLFTRYNATSNPIMFGVITLLFYLVVIAMLFFCIAKRRKELGGFIDLKDAFQTVFIAIIIGELIYCLFNVIYLKFIDPHFFDKWQVSMQDFLERTIKDDAKREETLNNFNEQIEKQKQRGLTIQGIALSYLVSVAITGVIGLIAALIMRKKRPVFEQLDQSVQ